MTEQDPAPPTEAEDHEGRKRQKNLVAAILRQSDADTVDDLIQDDDEDEVEEAE